MTFLSRYGAVQGVDQRLNLDELAACALGLVPVKWSGQYLCMRVPVFDHAFTSLFQGFKSFIHFGTLAHIAVATDKIGLSRSRKEPGLGGR